MREQDFEYYLENLRLKKEFALLGLDLAPVMDFLPQQMEIENRRLENLLEFVQKYQTCEDQKTMEIMGYLFPPIFPAISPKDDWYRFELWMRHQPVRKQLKAIIEQGNRFKAPDELSDVLLSKELLKLAHVLARAGYHVEIQTDAPNRLIYEYLWETLEEDFDLTLDGGWILDGCSGYCPGCFQRPWCDTGQESCWQEDKRAGKMCLPDSVKDYVSASPNSLPILQYHQALEDAAFDDFQAHLKDRDSNIPF